MFGGSAGFSRKQTTQLLTAAAITIATDRLFATIVLEEYLLINTVAAVAVAMGVLFGPSAAVGVGVGSMIADILQLTLTPQTLLLSVTLFGLGTLSHLFARSGRDLFGRGEVRVEPVLKLVGTVLLAVLFSASFYAWGQELLGRFPFYTTFVFTAISYLLGALLAIPFVVVGMRSELVARNRAVRSVGQEPLPRWVVTAILLWPVLATIGSLGFRIRERIQTPFTFRRLGIEFVYDFTSPAVFGQGGRRAQVLVGAMVLTVVGYRFVRLDGAGSEAEK